MRTRIFLAFAFVITLTLFSNIALRGLTLSDFDDYVEGGREDDIYVVLASLEGAYEEAGWDVNKLCEVARWALMLGFEISVQDAAGEFLADTRLALANTGPLELRRLEGLGRRLSESKEPFETYPLFLFGDRIGSLDIREAGGVSAAGGERSEVFRRRAQTFLLVSIIGTGAGAFLVGLAFALYLSRPVRALTSAVRSVQEGRLDTRVDVSGGGDEICELGRAFNSMAETLERQERLRKDLVTDLAHELRTPVTILSGTLEAIEDGVIPPDERAFGSIREEINRIGRFVPVVEEMARSESGYFFLKKEPVDLAALALDVAGGFRPLFERKGVTLRCEPGRDGGLSVQGDPDKLTQVLVNLLSNALAHTSEGWVRISTGTEGEWEVLRVTDTGSGIPEEIKDRIFDRYIKGSESGGLGIGLTIVKNIVEAHDGIVEATAREGGGSCFSVRLPRLSAAAGSET